MLAGSQLRSHASQRNKELDEKLARHRKIKCSPVELDERRSIRTRAGATT